MEDLENSSRKDSAGSSIKRKRESKRKTDFDEDKLPPVKAKEEGKMSLNSNNSAQDEGGGSESQGSQKKLKDKRRNSSKIKMKEDAKLNTEQEIPSPPPTRKSGEESQIQQQQPEENIPKKSVTGETPKRESFVEERGKPVIEDDADEGFSIFRIVDADVYDTTSDGDDKQSSKSSKGKKKKEPTPTPLSSREEEFYESESLDLEEEMNSYYEDIESYAEYEYMDETLNDEEEEEEIVERQKSRGTLLREQWERISAEIVRDFNSPCRVFKLRGYHSEPDLTLPFEEKFDPKIEDEWHGEIKGISSDYEFEDNLRKVKEKFVSCEDIVHPISAKEYPDLVRGALSEVKLRSYAMDDNMKNSWWQLYDWERKRFSFFDELFAMGYVVDSLEVLSPPPKDADGKPITTGEYFVEADEKHYRKKVDYGRVVFKTKHVYTGNFMDWYFEGPGRYCWQDGTVYQGEFSNGLMHGPGSIHWPDGCIYEGHFIYGKRTGWGVYFSADGRNTYAGEWLNGLPHGHGKMWYDPDDDDNDYYEGQWERGLPRGAGTRQYSTGDRYIGNWTDGLRNGYGIMIWLQERQVYKGEWLNGVPHGFGKHIWYLERSPNNSFPTRHVYQGNWIMGKREGIGKMVYPCGSIYEGRWKNGQRHGKGIFINPAGDILVGLFRAGSIMGGSDVPLHAPTYDCDYVGLTEWLTVKFDLPLREDNVEEERLLEITKQYLPYLRKLYHRAGEYSHKYGKHGLYPAYLKKNYGAHNFGVTSSTDNKDPFQFHENDHIDQFDRHHAHHPREYSRVVEPEHMHGKTEKPETLDGVHPVTRFGLWLLLRDCDNVLDEVTMAYYDKIWCETPPLSFQTRHNPFEPVYLWQFLQAIIVAAVAYHNDIPRLRQHAEEKAENAMEPPAVSDTTLKIGISYAEHQRAMIARRLKAVLTSKQTKPIADDHQTVGGKSKSIHHRRAKSTHVLKEDAKTEKKHHHRKHSKQEVVHDGGVDLGQNNNKLNVPGGEKERLGRSTSDLSDVGKSRKGSQVEQAVGAKRISVNSSNNNRGSKLRTRKVSLKTSEDEIEMDEEEEEEEHFEVKDDKKSPHHDVEENEINSAKPVAPPPGFSISECFEKFLTKKLLPCLRREAGNNLPVMPQPLPALVDMYDAFKGIKQRDIIKGKEFLRSALPHRMFPNAKDALWWHRCPEPLSHQVDLDELLEMMRRKFENVEEEFLLEENNFEDKFESEYLGAQAQNSETTMRLLKLCRENPLSTECPSGSLAVGRAPPLPIVNSDEIIAELAKVADDNDDLANLADYTAEGHPFAEDELVPEPFLWADDYKCIPVRRKYQHFENINTRDVLGVIKQLYPELCSGRHEKDFQFELIFCDWLWCISLLAKKSTERECRDAWKSKSDTRPLTNPQSLGVYAHYLKQIKNNPYLSPTPPPGFKPKKKQRQTELIPAETEEKKVKFL